MQIRVKEMFGLRKTSNKRGEICYIGQSRTEWARDMQATLTPNAEKAAAVLFSLSLSCFPLSFHIKSGLHSSISASPL